MKEKLCYNNLQLGDDMRNLPIGIQTFEKLILSDSVYIDKTEIIYNLASTQKPYFLSRPRRFGKSLLCSTFIALFQGKKELFKNFWIEKSDWDWKSYPVIHLDFSRMTVTTAEKFEINLFWKIGQLAEEFNLDISSAHSIEAAFETLIQKLAQRQEKIVLIIDEYDNPILEHLNRPNVAEEMREILKNFYKTVKSLDQFFRFIFITGVSRFSHTTIFSGMNNLTDLTFDKKAATLCGCTHEELLTNFDEDIEKLAKEENLEKNVVIEKLRLYYNGYRFCRYDVDKVYNPFSLLLCFEHCEFENYWIKTGIPSFLIYYVEKYGYLPNFENIQINIAEMDPLKITDIKFELLFLQAGYITIIDYDETKKSYILSYPNFEVREAFTQQIVKLITSIDSIEYSNYFQDLKVALNSGDLDKLCHVFDKFLKRIPYTLMTAPKEKHFQLLFYAVIELLGETIAVEDPTESGRIDSVIMTRNKIYIFEFKIRSTPEKALAQIEDKKYFEKFEKYKKDIVMIGISFNPDEHDPQKSRLEYKIKTIVTK